MNRAHILACINAAQLAGFTHYAAGIAALYRREYGCELLPDDRVERDGETTRISE